MGIDVVTLALSRKYTNGVALNGVTVQTPQIDLGTRNWLVFNPGTNAYVDTGIRAEGVTPHVGGNGHWWLDTTDTGIPAEGKSAYQVWLDLGNVGTEQYFIDSITGYPEDLISADTPNALKLGTDDKLLVSPSTADGYTHEQTAPATQWLIQHNLGKQISGIFAVDATGVEIIGRRNIAASTLNLLVMEYSEPVAGFAYI